MSIEREEETKQVCLWNDMIPGVHGIGDTQEDVIKEYMSALQDYLLISYKKTDAYQIHQ